MYALATFLDPATRIWFPYLPQCAQDATRAYLRTQLQQVLPREDSLPTGANQTLRSIFNPLGSTTATTTTTVDTEAKINAYLTDKLAVGENLNVC